MKATKTRKVMKTLAWIGWMAWGNHIRLVTLKNKGI